VVAVWHIVKYHHINSLFVNEFIKFPLATHIINRPIEEKSFELLLHSQVPLQLTCPMMMEEFIQLSLGQGLV